MNPNLFTIFSSPAADQAHLSLRTLGHLVHDGAIVACDPFTSEQNAFASRFPAGLHPVEALIMTQRGDERVALARVVFSPTAPVRFELATRGDEDLRALPPGHCFGYPVDAGSGCFAAVGAVEALDADALLGDFEAHRRLTWSWALARPRRGGHALVAFSSGFGDGIYPSYIGYGHNDEPVCLVTDFECLDLSLPDVPDDAPFRRRHAEHQYARMRAHANDLAGRGRGEAYGAAIRLRSVGADAAHLVAPLVADLRDAAGKHSFDGTMQIDLYEFALGGMTEAPAVQRALAPLLPTLDAPTRKRLLVRADEVDPTWLVAVRALWADGDVEVRHRILEIELRAAQHVRDSATLAHALEALTALDDGLVELGLRVLRDVELRHGATLAPSAVAALRAVAARAPAPVGDGRQNLRVHKIAFEILSRLGDDLGAALAAEPHTRLAAASALVNGPEPAGAARGDGVLIGLAQDVTLDPELRFEAASRIRDRSASIAAFIVCGLAGNAQAPIQLSNIGGADAIAAIERLAVEAADPAVRQGAVKAVKRAREIEAARR